jgi:hypothetical protein
LGNLERDVALGLLGGGAEVRREDDILAREQRVVLGRGLALEDVERGALEPSRRERVGERELVDEATARAVHEPCAGLHREDALAREDVARLVAVGDVQADEVGAREQLVEGQELDAFERRALAREVGIVGHDLHGEAEPARGDHATDATEADDAERLAGDLASGELAAQLPLARAHRAIAARHVAREREHERDRELGGGGRIAGGSVHHDHSARGGRIDVDVVHAHAGATDHLQARRRVEDRARHLGGRAHDECLHVVDARDELRFLEAGAHLGLEAVRREDVERLGGQLVADQDALRSRGGAGRGRCGRFSQRGRHRGVPRRA